MTRRQIADADIIDALRHYESLSRRNCSACEWLELKFSCNARKGAALLHQIGYRGGPLDIPALIAAHEQRQAAPELAKLLTLPR